MLEFYTFWKIYSLKLCSELLLRLIKFLVVPHQLYSYEKTNMNNFIIFTLTFCFNWSIVFSTYFSSLKSYHTPSIFNVSNHLFYEQRSLKQKRKAGNHYRNNCICTCALTLRHHLRKVLLWTKLPKALHY